MWSKFTLDDLNDNRAANFLAVGGAFVATLVASILSIDFWLSEDPSRNFVANVPGVDGRPAIMGLGEAEVDLTGYFETFDGSPSDLPGSWTQFRGPDSDNIGKDTPPLASSWGKDGPKVLWSAEIGEGYAAPAVLNGVVYLLDYDQERHADSLRSFSLEDGREIWRRSYSMKVKRNHGMSRTIPAVTDKYIVTMGPRCHVLCVDRKTGDFRWGIDFQKDYGTEQPLWYTGQCPIIVDGKAILAPCGKDTFMMAVDCETGATEWETPNPHGWNMSHSSVIPMTLAGKEMFVYCALGGIAGVSAEGEDAGTLLWEEPWDATTVAPSPVQISGDRIFMTTGYGKGNMVLHVTEDNGSYSVEVVDVRGPKEGLACEQQTPIYRDGLLYGIQPKDAGGLKGQFVCYREDGSLVWSSGSDNRYGIGPFLLADDKFFVLSDYGVLTMLDATKQEFVQLGQASLLDGHDTWGPLALAGTRMLLRNNEKLICIEVGANG